MALNEPELFQLLEQRVREAGSQLAFAKQHGLSPQYLSDVLRGRRLLGPKILDALGYEEAPRMYQHRWWPPARPAE